MSEGYTRFLSDEDQAQLIAVRDLQSNAAFGLGEFVLEHFHEHTMTTGDYGLLCKGIGAFVGMRAKDVREVARVTNWARVLRQLHPVLSFEYFRRAEKLGEFGEDALVWAEEQTDELNRPATLDALLAVYGSGQPAPEAKQDDTPGAVVALVKKHVRALVSLAGERQDLVERLEELEKDMLSGD